MVWWAKKTGNLSVCPKNCFWMTSSFRWFGVFSKWCQNQNQKYVDTFKVHLWSDSCVEKQERKHCCTYCPTAELASKVKICDLSQPEKTQSLWGPSVSPQSGTLAKVKVTRYVSKSWQSWLSVHTNSSHTGQRSHAVRGPLVEAIKPNVRLVCGGDFEQLHRSRRLWKHITGPEIKGSYISAPASQRGKVKTASIGTHRSRREFKD